HVEVEARRVFDATAQLYQPGGTAQLDLGVVELAAAVNGRTRQACGVERAALTNLAEAQRAGLAFHAHHAATAHRPGDVDLAGVEPGDGDGGAVAHLADAQALDLARQRHLAVADHWAAENDVGPIEPAGADAGAIADIAQAQGLDGAAQLHP